MELPVTPGSEHTREIADACPSLEVAQRTAMEGWAQHEWEEQQIGYLSLIFFQRGVGVCKEQSE